MYGSKDEKLSSEWVVLEVSILRKTAPQIAKGNFRGQQKWLQFPAEAIFVAPNKGILKCLFISTMAWCHSVL